MKLSLLIAALVSTCTLAQASADDQNLEQPEIQTLRDQGAILSRVRLNTNTSKRRITGVSLGRQWKGGDESLKAISAYSVLVLSLRDNPKVSDSTLAALRGVEAKYVKIQYVQVTEKGLDHLATMTGMKTLTLKYVPVTDEGIPALSKLKSIKRLNLWGTRVTMDGLDKLRAALPDCDIWYNSWNRLAK